MKPALRDGLTFCTIDGRTVFLDVPNDRYFQLAADLDQAFAALIAGDATDEAVRRRLQRAGLLAPARATAASPVVMPPRPCRTSPAIATGRVSIIGTAAAIIGQSCAERRLARTSLDAQLASLKVLTAGLSEVAPQVDTPAGGVVRAFEQAKLVRSDANRCLPRAIALVRGLARLRTRTRLVIGVRLTPFSAHAWVQAEDDVLSDTFEDVARYTPIYAL